MGIKFYDTSGKYWGKFDETRGLFTPSEEVLAGCETCANGEGDIEACGYCRHGDLYKPKTEPQTERSE